MSELNVFKRVQNVMAEIGTVEKNGTNSFQRYDYATEADFIRAVQPLLVKHGLAMVLVEQQILGVIAQEDANGKTGKFLTTLTSTYRIVNVDNPEDYLTVKAGGQGIDNGDKGVYKAITGAKKYAIANAFLIVTGDDPEKDQLTVKSSSNGRKTNVAEF